LAVKRIMRNFLLGLTTVLVSLLVALFIGELVIRFVWIPPSTLTTQSTEQHPVYGWSPRPGITGRHVTMEYDYSFTHTAQGMRGNTLFTATHPENIKNRILFLGDSFTYGIGSEDHEIFAEQINSSLPDTEVINTGANGYGQRQQLAILNTLGAAVSPNLVVLMFFWNDLEDNTKTSIPDFQVSADGTIVRTDLMTLESFKPLAHRMDNYQNNSNQQPLRKTYLYKLFKEGGRGIRHKLFGSKKRRIQTPAQQQAALTVTHDLLRLIRAQSLQLGSKLIVVSIPDYALVDPKNGYMKGQLPINIEIEEPLRKICEDLGIHYVDLLPELKRKQAAATVPYYYSTDRHFTPEGNQVIADILTPVLESLLKQSTPSAKQQ
jgi:lysophospholipase L1-like esterase